MTHAQNRALATACSLIKTFSRLQRSPIAVCPLEFRTAIKSVDLTGVDYVCFPSKAIWLSICIIASKVTSCSPFLTIFLFSHIYQEIHCTRKRTLHMGSSNGSLVRMGTTMVNLMRTQHICMPVRRDSELERFFCLAIRVHDGQVYYCWCFPVNSKRMCLLPAPLY